ncbi:MAG: DnaJ domain-containing protein [Acidimicrobiales bacterium]|nr:DnaJ domain-containing protein [Acidimicrobiales bacterium]
MAEASRVLGVADDAPWPEVRAAYRRLVRAHHPDVARHADAGRTTARITAAYTVLRASRDGPGRTEPGAGPVAGPVAEPLVAEPLVAEADTLLLDAPHDEAFFALLDGADRLGEVTYVDADAGLLEVIVELCGLPAASVVITLQGRAQGTEAFVTVEPLGATEAPATAAVVALLAELLGGGR